MSHAGGATAPVRGRREQRKVVTRRDLLEAGRRLFGEQGLYDCRVEDLTRGAGIAKGTLYGYFENKEQLMKAVVELGFSELLDEVKREARSVGGYRELLAATTRAHLRFYAANPDLVRIFHQVRGLLKYGRTEGRALKPVLAGYLAGLAEVLSPPHSGSQRNPSEALDVAAVLFGAVSGITSLRASLPGVLPRPANHDDTVRSVVALVLAYEGRAGS